MSKKDCQATLGDKKTFKWIPETLDGVFPDGQRWCLYQTNHPKGYPHYIGRVCKTRWDTGTVEYVSDVGIFPTMKGAACALLGACQYDLDSI